MTTVISGSSPSITFSDATTQTTAFTTPVSIANGGTGSSTLAGANIATTNSSTQSITSINTFGFKNRIINGGMTISQRNGTTSTSQVHAAYNLDRWFGYSYQSGVTTGKYTVAQSTSAPSNYINSLLLTSSTATSSASGDLYLIGQFIEGFNIADLGWGTSSGKSVTLSFWVQSSVTGTFGGAVRNQNNNCAYPFTYTISTANTWTQATITMPAPTTGTTWQTDNSQGICIFFNVQLGSSVTLTANGTWQTSACYGASGCVNLLTSSGNTLYITGVQLEVGSQATSFDFRDYGRELFLCQRYFQIVGGTNTEHFAMGVMSTTQINIVYGLKQTMRTSPSFSAINYGSAYSYLQLYFGTGQTAATGTSENYMSPNNISIGFTHSGSLITNGLAGYIFFNSTLGRISFSAEL